MTGLYSGDFIIIAIAVVLLILLILVILLIVQSCKIKKLKQRLDRFMLGKEGKSIEDELIKICEDNKYLKQNADENKKDIRDLYKKLESAYQKMGVVKYDAFNQMGGQLSFSLALLDENNNGFIINSVHSTEGCYSYTKEIKAGECDISLGDEEKQALEIAMNNK
jgi:ABC-type Na+ efflux pump permease subunit